MRTRKNYARMGTNLAAAMGTYHPGGTAETPMVMPVQLVTVTAGAGTPGPFVTLGSAEFNPLWTTDGALIPSVAPGRWAQLHAAGRP